MTSHTSARPSPLAANPLAPRAAALREGAADLHATIDEALDRIDRFDARVRAFLPEPGRRERVHAAADALIARYLDTSTRPPLYGVLVGVKDIFVVDGLPTRAGSAIPPEEFTMPQGPAVTRLLEAGAIVLGKTVTTEFAYMEPGATTNPYNPLHTPGGSSSGSAAAIACGYVPLSIGSQTVGSVIRPAGFCGVVGYKGSYDRVPTDGALAYSPSVDHVGWFSQDVAGARIVASVMYEDWRGDLPHRRPVIGVPDGPFLEQAERAAIASFEATLGVLADRGVEVRRIPFFDDIAGINQRHYNVSTAEFGDTHAERFVKWGSMFRAGSAALYDASFTVTPEARAEGFASRLELRARIDEAMAREGIDVWASMPSTGPAPRGLAFTGDRAMNVPWTHAGSPCITIPSGVVEGLPVGLQLTGRFGGDEELFAAAEAVEALLWA